MPPKKNEKKDKKEDKKVKPKKESTKSGTKEVKKSSKKSSKKEQKKKTSKEESKISKKNVKKNTEKQVLKSVKKIEIKKPKQKKLSKDSDEESNNSESEESSKEESIFSESEEEDNYEITDTKMTDFFSDDNDSQTIDDSELTEYKTDIDSSAIDSSDPKEKIYNDLINTLNKEKNLSSKGEPLTIVSKEQRLTNPRMTKYEMVRIIGERTKQLTMLAKPLVKNTDDLTYEEIAILELRKNVIPFKIKRPLPNNTIEIWEVNELNKDHLEF